MTHRYREIIQISGLMFTSTASRFLGFLKGILIVHVIGVGIGGDIYILGNFIPNMAYVLIGGGSIAAIFMPQIIKRKFGESAGEYNFQLLLITGGILVCLCLFFYLFIPQLLSVLLPSYSEKNLELLVIISRIGICQLLFMGISNIGGQILNSYDKFLIIGFATLANNIVVISFFLFYVGISEEKLLSFPFTEMKILEVGTVLGTATQFLLIVSVMMYRDIEIRVSLRNFSQTLRETLSKSLHSSYLIVVSQVSYVITLVLTANAQSRLENAKLYSTAGISAYGNAQLIAFIPYWLVTIPVLTVLMPRIIQIVQKSDTELLNSGFQLLYRSISILNLPMIAFLIFESKSLLQVLFPQLSPSAISVLSLELIIFSIAVIPTTLNIQALRFLNAHDDLRSQIKSTTVMNVFFAVLITPIALLVPDQYVIYVVTSGVVLSNCVGAESALMQLKSYGVNLRQLRENLRQAGLLFLSFVVLAIIRKIFSAVSMNEPIRLGLTFVIFCASLYIALRRLRFKEIDYLVRNIRLNKPKTS